MESNEQLRERAYEIWVADGKPDGRALDHWFQAKEELSAYKALGTAEYASWQRGSVVTVRASGVLPSSGFTAALEPNRLEPADPRNGNAFVGYMLVFRRGRVGNPESGPVGFRVDATFEYRGSVFEILVYDRDGEHRL